MFLNPDKARVDGPRHVLQRALEEEVATRVADPVVLERVEVEELLSRAEVDRFELRAGPFTSKRGLDSGLRELAAEGHVEQAQRRVLLQLRALVSQMPHVAAPLLDRDIGDLRTLAEEDLGRASAIAGF